ncbi:MAG: redoxin family protein [Promethearchaeota archaeon]
MGSISAKNKYKLIFLVIISSVIFFNATSSYSRPIITAKHLQLPAGSSAPNFILTDIISGEQFSLSELEGNVVILDLFATWCSSCVQALPKIREIYQAYSNDELTIISIDIEQDEDEQQVRDFINEHNMEWFVAFDNNSIVNNNYGSGFIPTLYVIDRNQKVAYSEIGFDYEAVIDVLDQLSLEPTKQLPNNSPNFGMVPLIWVGGIGFLAIFVVGLILYSRYQEKKQTEIYRMGSFHHQQEIRPPTTFQDINFGEICPTCNHLIHVKAKFCTNCGSDLRKYF